MDKEKIISLENLNQYSEETSGKIKKKIAEHTDNGDIHVTTADKSKWNSKFDSNQGTSNAGKLLGTNSSGDVVAIQGYGFEYDETTKMLKYGTDPTTNLNQGIGLDDTLSKKGYAAEASAVGELKSDLVNYINYNRLENTTWIDKRYLNPSTGEERYNASYSVCYLQVKGGSYFELTVDNDYFICFYDKAHTFIGSTTNKNFSVPKNTCVLGVSMNTSDIPNSKLIDISVEEKSKIEILKSKIKEENFVFVDGKYKKFNDGAIASNSSYCYTDINVNPNDIIALNKQGNIVTFFDENLTFVGSTLQRVFKVPNKAIYMTISLGITEKEDLYVETNVVKCIVTPNNYSNLKNAVDEASSLGLPIELHSGIYDVTNTNNGLYVNTSIYGVGNPKIYCNLDTYNENFSPINLGVNAENVVIDGVNIEANNCRYCIHDEMGGADETRGYIHKIKNCHLKCDSRTVRPFGVGLGGNGRFIVDSCILEQENSLSNEPLLAIHSGYSGQTKDSYVSVNNCVCKNGTILVNEESQYSGFKNICVVSNCFVKSNVQFETTTGNQIDFYEFNNHVSNSN